MISEGWDLELEWVHSFGMQTSRITLCTVNPSVNTVLVCFLLFRFWHEDIPKLFKKKASKKGKDEL